ncbi:hypothetical protein A4H97_22900 [Niastella yeongjuensis]|uniref:Iron dicitrate transport regulator FecR n=1 Tax=Niastella yeongjuensis TaxID=354355 RepID=A0A1V9F7P5_9BACT|nr:FecR family protein [Niastella yeongjuensis]OQP54335.1 hypothetical protein A4H97_22900 [Niastella yeongjuensis]SEP30015.1 FecR family protein [Niastella yeongjuensis]
MTNQNISELLFKQLRNELTPEEAVELESWLKQSPANQQLYDEINNIPALMEQVRVYGLAEQEVNDSWAKLHARYLMEYPAYKRREFRMRVIMYTAAAAVVLCASLLMYWWLKPAKPSPHTPVVAKAVQHDVTPTTTHAYLTLDDGTSIRLDSLKAGLLATQGNVQVTKQESGLLSYTARTGAPGDRSMTYNRISVPKGSDVVYLQLSDGSNVWLNAESSIKYPVAFNNEERKVEITGEAYFEVAKSHGKRFVVSKGNMSVTVLGTKFNVNTYENENDIKVTLMEGSVKVQQEQVAQIIKPGQQAVVKGPSINIESDVDMHQVLAWKDGKFLFNNTNIQQIMRQLERWYDLSPTQFENEAVKKWEFNGEISRYSNASKVLELLEKTGSVKFIVEGKKIVVKPI